jgi:ankyrin repeat protein
MLSLHHACIAKAPYYAISYLVQTWLSSMDDMHDWIPLHLACIANAPVETLRYLADENWSIIEKKDNRGYTPLMYVLEDKRDVNDIECVCN